MLVSYTNIWGCETFVFAAGNGFITTGVLREILKELDDKISAEELDMMIEEIDSDGSGTVDFDGMLLKWKIRWCIEFLDFRD